MALQTIDIQLQAGPIDSTDVHAFRVVRRLGLVAHAEVSVKSSEAVDPDDLLGAPARLAFGRGRAEHVFDGIITDVDVDATPDDLDERGTVHHLRITSRLGLLEQEVDCAIYQEKDVKEIVTEVLASLGVEAGRQSWRLVGTYPRRTYCVQYNESALAFVSRLLEEEGIHCFSDSDDQGELLVLEDDSTAADPIEGDKVVPYRHVAGFSVGDDAIGVITHRRRTATGKVTLRDYDFKKPELDLTASAAADADADLEVYDYPGLYVAKADGERLARVRLEALSAERAVLHVRAGCPRLLPGRWLEIRETPNDLDGPYFITGAIHEMKDGRYVVEATLIPKRTRFRPPQRTPRPVIDGPQTARVVAPPGAPPEEIHTDEHGRCKVQFHWN